jgi:hypothetical protein
LETIFGLIRKIFLASLLSLCGVADKSIKTILQWKPICGAASPSMTGLFLTIFVFYIAVYYLELKILLA